MVLIGKAGASNDSILASARSKPPSSLMTQRVLDKSQSEPRTNTDALHHAAQSDANRLARFADRALITVSFSGPVELFQVQLVNQHRQLVL